MTLERYSSARFPGAFLLIALAAACGPRTSTTADGGITLPTDTCDNPTKRAGIQCPVTAGTALPVGLAQTGAVAANGYLYVVGGTQVNTGAQSRAEVYYAQVGTNDTLGAWGVTTSLPAVRAKVAVAAANGFIYVLGGVVGGTSSDVTQKSVYIGTIAADGTISGWTNGPDLPEDRAAGAAVVVNNSLYMIAGYTSANKGDVGLEKEGHVFRAEIQGDGSLGAWSQTASLPGGRANFSAAVAHDRIYVVGGNYLSSAGACEDSKVLVGFLDSSGEVTGWAKASSFAQDVRSGAAVVINDTLVVGGGFVMATQVNTSSIVAAPIDPSDGSVGAWKEIAQLPARTNSLSAASTGGSVFFMGGSGGSAALPLATATRIGVAGGTALCSP